jgi:hypothetical protein
MADIRTHCKHCGKELVKVMLPDESDWDVEFVLACMDDDCPYYVRGWEHMNENYKVKHSYHFFINPESGYEGPLPVSRPTDYKDRIVQKFVEE